MLTITLFNIVHGDVEGAWQGSDLPETSIVSGAAKAYLGPSIGRLVPYAGLGVGVYRQSLPTKSDQGSYGLLFAGAKLKFPFGLVLRGEYQWLDMPDEVTLAFDNRYLFALGLSF
jgi:opacity protein-like surface antigen